jgi:putative DNA primase/helicase
VTTILDTARDLLAHGYSVIPIRTDGSKAPALPAWKRHTTERATDVDLVAWFGGNLPHDLGVVQGAVSGGAELTEIEGRAAARLPELKALADDTGLADLWALVTTGWVEMSPSGGYHFHYRLDGDVPGNLKLARAADKLVLAETRGEGGQVVVAPSRHHVTGRPWTRLIGGPATAPVITPEQRDAFHGLLRTLDEQPDAGPVVTSTPAAPHDPTAGITPGDDYENRTDWADILTPHGWTLVSQRGRTRYWLRPGKPRGSGLSATTGHADDRDRLFVFTSSTDFDQEVPYTKLGAYAVLEHGGDMSAAARQLYADGFGQRAEEARPAHASGDDLAGLIAPTNGDTSWTTTSAPASPTTPTAAAPATAAGPAPATSSTAPATSPGTASTASASDGPATYSETDDGNALRLVDQHAGVIRYVPQRGSWLTWNGHRWTWDEAGHVHELARGIARGLDVLAPDGKRDKEKVRHRASSLSRRGLEAMVVLARTDPRTVTHLAALDARPYELNTPAGAVDLRSGALRPPDPAALHTRTTLTAPDFDTTPTMWLSFLADTFAGDPELTTYVQRLLGVSLAGIVLEQVLPFAHGAGKNGKSTLLEVVQHLIGIGDGGYSISLPADALIARRNEDHPAHIAQLSGVRMAVSSEIEEGAQFAEAKIKMLTGGDSINARFMNRNPFTFVPTHTLWLHANHQPEVRTGGPAFWRRLRLLPFEHAVPEAKRIKNLRELLVEREGPAILAWLIRGAADYFSSGLQEPASVVAATDAYAGDQDSVGRFVTDMCETGSPNAQHMQIRMAELRAAYDAYCQAEGERPVSAKSFGMQLRARFGVEAPRSNSTRFYSGIRLIERSPEGDDRSRPAERWFQDGAL